MHVAPAPRFAALERRDHRVAGRIEVLQSVRVLRVLATADVAAGEAHPKLVPGRAARETLFAAIGAGRDFPDLAEMLAAFAQGLSWLECYPDSGYALAGAPIIRIAVFETCIVSKYA